MTAVLLAAILAVRAGADDNSQSPAEAVLETLQAADAAYGAGRWQEALDAYRETLQLDQESRALGAARLSRIYERMGASYNKLGLASDAVEALRRSIQRSAENSGAFYELALAYAASREARRSLLALGSALRNASSRAALRRLSLLARTDPELAAVRDLPGFRPLLERYNERR